MFLYEYFTRPSHADCCIWLYSICREQNFPVSIEYLDQLVTLYQCDLRTCIHFLQFKSAQTGVQRCLPAATNLPGTEIPHYITTYAIDYYLHELNNCLELKNFVQKSRKRLRQQQESEDEVEFDLPQISKPSIDPIEATEQLDALEAMADAADSFSFTNLLESKELGKTICHSTVQRCLSKIPEYTQIKRERVERPVKECIRAALEETRQDSIQQQHRNDRIYDLFDLAVYYHRLYPEAGYVSLI